MRDELLSDVLDAESLAEQMADNSRIKALLHGYNRIAAVSGRLELIDITDDGLKLKEAIKQLSAKEQLLLLLKYHDTLEDVEAMERDNHKFKLINKVITWTLSLITVVILAAIALLFLSTFYGKELPGLGLIKDSLDILFEIFKLVFPI